MTPKFQIGQKVNTPNGPGIFQHMMSSDGEHYPMVSYPPNADINIDLCKSYYHVPGGMWWLCGYEPAQVEAV